MADTPATPKDARGLIRQQLVAWLTSELTKAGYTVSLPQNGRLVTVTDGSGTYLGDLETNAQGSWRGDELVPYGEVVLRPVAGGDGTYKVQVNGRINLTSLKARLQQLVPLAVEAGLARQARKARELADGALEQALGRWPAGVQHLSVYDGRVDIKLADLTAAQAQQLLALMRGWAPAAGETCESTLGELRCELPAGHGRFHKHGTAGWDDGA